jgi:hypothetical protein
MKKFAGKKPLETIRQQCKLQGVHFNDFLFRTQRSDYVVLTSKKGNNDSGQVLYNTFNGTFFGTTPAKRDWHHPLVNKFCPPAGVEFDSNSTEHENEPWFQALLSFFYVEK